MSTTYYVYELRLEGEEPKKFLFDTEAECRAFAEKMDKMLADKGIDVTKVEGPPE